MSAVPEAQAQLDVGGVVVRVGFRAITPVCVAGGVCEVELLFEVGDRFALPVGRERATGRLAHLAIDGRLGTDVLEDPAAGAVQVGGPSGTVPVEPAAAYREPVLVNEFLGLERTPELLEPGGTGLLELDLRRALRPTGDPTASARLAVPVRRDDAALAAEIERLAGALREEWRPATSNRVERALAALVSMRLPAARETLAGLAEHPNPLVRAQADRAAR